MGRLKTITAKTLIFDATRDGGACSEFFVGCNPTSANGADIFVDNLHVGDGFPLYPDTGITFKNNEAIEKVWATPVGGDAILDYGVVSKNNA